MTEDTCWSLDIATLLKPTKNIFCRTQVECLEQCAIDLEIGQFCHGEADIIAITTETIFHCRESKFDWVVVR